MKQDRRYSLKSYPSDHAVVLDLTHEHLITEVVFNTGVILRLPESTSLMECRAYKLHYQVKGTTYSGAVTLPTGLRHGGAKTK